MHSRETLVRFLATLDALGVYPAPKSLAKQNAPASNFCRPATLATAFAEKKKVQTVGLLSCEKHRARLFPRKRETGESRKRKKKGGRRTRTPLLRNSPVLRAIPAVQGCPNAHKSSASKTTIWQTASVSRCKKKRSVGLATAQADERKQPRACVARSTPFFCTGHATNDLLFRGGGVEKQMDLDGKEKKSAPPRTRGRRFQRAMRAENATHSVGTRCVSAVLYLFFFFFDRPVPWVSWPT